MPPTIISSEYARLHLTDGSHQRVLVGTLLYDIRDSRPGAFLQETGTDITYYNGDYALEEYNIVESGIFTRFNH
jgi:hypothetical protein